MRMPAIALGGLLVCSGCHGKQVGRTLDERADDLIAEMSLTDKVEQMHGLQLGPIDDLYYTIEIPRLGIPAFKMVDGPRGVRAGTATAFPVAIARGATWNPALEHQVGVAIGLETAAKGGNVILAPTINNLRHPFWGRAQETYGEDVHLLGRMGVAFIEGAQEQVMACAKHFAANSIELSRFDVDVTVDERTLREIYLKHFEAAVKEARVACVMSAYNSVNGRYASENRHLLRDILKEEWQFDGFVVSDWLLATHSTVDSVQAGLDIEMPHAHYYGSPVALAVQDGQLPIELVDDAVRRTLRQKLRFQVGVPREIADEQLSGSPELALEVARQAIVLLKNEAGALPLPESQLTSIAVGGPLADVDNIGDTGSSAVSPPYVVTALEGLQQRLGSGPTIATFGALPLSGAEEQAISDADAAILVVGLTSADEGEYIPPHQGDRSQLGLSADQVELITAVSALSTRTIVVVEGGSAIGMAAWIDQVEAVVLAWYPGQEGGHAIAEVLAGDVNPSGRLPLSIPADIEQLPPFDNQGDAVTYGYLHGYRWLDAQQLEPLFPFGHGLSYTDFRLDDIRPDSVSLASGDLEPVQFEVDVTNLGDRSGCDVVQLYASFPSSAVMRPIRQLVAFDRVCVEPGDTQAARLTVHPRDLAYYDVAAGDWIIEQTEHVITAGRSSRSIELEAVVTVSR